MLRGARRGGTARMLPLLLAAAAWRRINAPLSRVAGLLTVTLAAASLCALFVTSPIADRSFNAGGFVGALVAESLRGMLNTVGAGVLLSALAAIGLLLATNFSFVGAYERIASALANPTGSFRVTLERFRSWREARREQAHARAEMRREAREAREREIRESLQLAPLPGAGEAANPTVSAKRAATEGARAASAVRRAANAAPAAEKLSPEDEVRAKLAKAEAELAAIADAAHNPPAHEAPPPPIIAPKAKRVVSP